MFDMTPDVDVLFQDGMFSIRNRASILSLATWESCFVVNATLARLPEDDLQDTAKRGEC